MDHDDKIDLISAILATAGANKVPKGDVILAFRLIRKLLKEEGLDGVAAAPRTLKDAVQADTSFSPQP